MFNIKNLTKKIKNKKLKGNISLLVILVLLATSVITLLSINQIMRLITYGNQTFNYFRAYYLAKAGTELGLAEVYNREDGFNHSVSSDNSIISGNLVGDYEAFNPYFNMSISGRFETLTNDIRNLNCDENNKIRLETGAGIMLSLFSDETKGTFQILSTGTNENNIKELNVNNIKRLELKEPSPNDAQLTFAFFTYEKYTDSETKITDYVIDDIIVRDKKSPGDLKNFLTDDNEAKSLVGKDIKKKYLTIKNSGDKPIEFCITMGDEPIPYSNFLITTIGHYGDTEVGIQSIVKKGVPDWTLNVWGKEE